jgi:hypothetical protein
VKAGLPTNHAEPPCDKEIVVLFQSLLLEHVASTSAVLLNWN